MTPVDWTEVGTELFLAELDRVSDGEFQLPAKLPGWTRGHVVAHVHYNAVALCRLVSWAATGVESRMYASPEQRNHEIQQGATLPPLELRRLVRESAEQLGSCVQRSLARCPDELGRYGARPHRTRHGSRMDARPRGHGPHG